MALLGYAIEFDREAREWRRFFTERESTDREEVRKMAKKDYDDKPNINLLCRCVDTLCRQTIADTGQHVSGSTLLDEECDQPAVMHLFGIEAMSGGPVAFCEPCGDNALQSGAWATSEDVAAARREVGTDV